jgi:hypothetical protein
VVAAFAATAAGLFATIAATWRRTRSAAINRVAKNRVLRGCLTEKIAFPPRPRVFCEGVSPKKSIPHHVRAQAPGKIASRKIVCLRLEMGGVFFAPSDFPPRPRDRHLEKSRREKSCARFFAKDPRYSVVEH